MLFVCTHVLIITVLCDVANKMSGLDPAESAKTLAQGQEQGKDQVETATNNVRRVADYQMKRPANHVSVIRTSLSSLPFMQARRLAS